MPITLEWVPDTAVLWVTYTGLIRHADYHAMVRQRQDLIRDHGAPFALVADMRVFEGLHDPARLPADAGVFEEPLLVAQILVFPQDLYDHCAASILHQGDTLRAFIVAQRDQALALAARLAP